MFYRTLKTRVVEGFDATIAPPPPKLFLERGILSEGLIHTVTTVGELSDSHDVEFHKSA
jgi:hypothetical protein